MALRTFFAVELGGAARLAAAGVAAALRGRPDGDDWRWVPEESLYVTLRFLGATEAGAVPALREAVGEALADVAPFALGLGAPMALPSTRRPRVVALALEPAGPVSALAAAVESGVRAAGWPAEERPFRPHVTLGRVRRGRRGSSDLVTASVTPPSQAWEVREIVLLQSQLSPGGSRYAPLERIPLHP